MAKRSQEDVKIWKAKMSELSAKVRAMGQEQKAEMAANFGTLTAEGRTLSPHNSIMLWMQYGEACAQVGGFKQWQRVGRKVIKGQHAAGYIYVPIGGKKADRDPERTEDPERMRFRLVPVFDVEQTEVI